MKRTRKYGDITVTENDEGEIKATTSGHTESRLEELNLAIERFIREEYVLQILV